MYLRILDRTCEDIVIKIEEDLFIDSPTKYASEVHDYDYASHQTTEKVNDE